MPMHDSCRIGFRWNGTPMGHEIQLGDHQAYVTGMNKDRAILYCHDGFGWKFNNARLLADHFAQEVGAMVYIPDLFHGTAAPIDTEMLASGAMQSIQSPNFDWAGFLATNSLEIRVPEILAFARLLRDRYTKLGAVGYCWGGLAGWKLASKEHAALFDCITIAHPGTPTKEDILRIGVPVQILAAEMDPMFEAEWRRLCNEEIPKLGVGYQFNFFPGRSHGFATRCDEEIEEEKRALEWAKEAVVFWGKAHLY